MNSIEIVIRMGDRTRTDDGQVIWDWPDMRTALVSGENDESMKSEALRMAEALLKQMGKQ